MRFPRVFEMAPSTCRLRVHHHSMVMASMAPLPFESGMSLTYTDATKKLMLQCRRSLSRAEWIISGHLVSTNPSASAQDATAALAALAGPPT